MPLSGISVHKKEECVIGMETDIERYPQVYPHYREALGVLQGILAFQAAQAAQIEPGPLIDLSIAQARWQAGLPLFSSESTAISHRRLQAALAEVRAWLPQAGQAQATLDRLLASGRMDSADTASLLDGFSRNGTARLQQWAAEMSVDPTILAGLLHTVLTPFYQQQAVPYRPWIETSGWRRGNCPLCGAEPSLARLIREDGRRILVCSLCRSEWPFDRLRCPFCETDSPPHIRYFTVDGDPAHRVDCCGQCRRYLKTVDERVLGFRTNSAAEEVVTADLDRLAQEQGYQ